MQVKFIVAAIAAMAAAGAQAVVVDPTGATADVTIYVSGASAQKPALEATVATAVCAVPGDVVKMSDTSGTGSKGWFCKGKGSALNKNVLVLHRTKGGSAAGVNQVLSTATNESEAETIDFATCGSFDAVAKTAVCTGKKKVESVMALSDVKATEYAAGILGSGAGYLAPSALTTVAVGLQGFGIVANPAMYTALQEQNVADGLLAASCVGNTVDAACQPSISSADYASVASVGGLTKDAASLVPAATATGALTLCRRVDTSGTQASSNLFFLNNVCGSKGYGGAEVPATNLDYSWVIENSETADVKACVNNAADLRLGVVSLENVPGASDSYKFVKIDGVSPNFTAAGAVDAKQKTNVRNGTYKFAIEAYAMYKGTTLEKAVAKQIADTLKSSTQDLVGVLSLSGTGSTSALYKRGGNNCAPLVKR